MVNVEPYEYQRKTNLKEHNDLVAKINEIVDVINNNNLDTILPKISKLETDVSTIKATDSLQWTDIESLKTKNTEYDTHFGINDTQIDGITKSLVSNVALMNGTSTGNVKVRIERADAPSIDSTDYNIQKPTSVELVQGSAPAMVKAQITLSDGTVLISDDFMFTTEAIGTDVYISSFVFKNGNVAGTISADIGLSNGTTIEANNFVVPMDPSLLNTVQDLSTRLSAVEGGSVEGLNELKTTVNNHTASISALDTDVANLQIDKADVSTVETLTNTVNGKVNVAQGLNNVGKVLGINVSGNVEPTEINSGGEVVDMPNTMSELYNLITLGSFIFGRDLQIKDGVGTTTLVNFSGIYFGNVGTTKFILFNGGTVSYSGTSYNYCTGTIEIHPDGSANFEGYGSYNNGYNRFGFSTDVPTSFSPVECKVKT